MKLEEVKQILTVLKTNYPSSFKGWTTDQSYDFLNLWAEAFKDDDVATVVLAVKTIIYTDTREFYPNIAQVKQTIYNLTHQDALDEYEAFNVVLESLENAQWKAEDEFNKLPKNIQKCVGSAKTLYEWAWCDSKTVSSVIASNFYKAYRKMVETDRVDKALPLEVKNLIVQKQKELIETS